MSCPANLLRARFRLDLRSASLDFNLTHIHHAGQHCFNLMRMLSGVCGRHLMDTQWWLGVPGHYVRVYMSVCVDFVRWKCVLKLKLKLKVKFDFERVEVERCMVDWWMVWILAEVGSEFIVVVIVQELFRCMEVLRLYLRNCERKQRNE